MITLVCTGLILQNRICKEIGRVERAIIRNIETGIIKKENKDDVTYDYDESKIYA